MQAKSTVEVEGNQVHQNLRLVDLLEDHDDVQRVTANFESRTTCWPRPWHEALPDRRLRVPDDVLAEAMA